MKNANETRDKVHGFIEAVKQLQNDAANGLKQAVGKWAVIQEKLAEFFIYRKDQVAVGALDELKSPILAR